MADKTRNGNSWTESRYHSFIKGGLRAASRRWPPKYTCLNDACVGQKINSNTGRIAKHYTCSCCGFDYPAKDVQVNHIESVVPLTGFTTWDDVVDRLFCEADGLEVLCIPCHKLVTQREREMRKEFDNPEIKSTYQSWLDMKGRCFNEKSQRFYTHGARGITVCDEWKYNFDAFVKDMGVKPSLEFSIERIDNDGNYCKDNCKWATAKEQGANRRTNIYVEYNGETKTVAQWADQLGISHSAFTKRLANWPDMDEVMYQGRATKSTFPKPKKEIINE